MRSILLILAILAQAGVHSQTFPVNSIINNGADDKRINVVFLSDGYTNGQLPQYLTDAGQTAADLYNTTPFKEYKNFFNTYAISVPSVESGADHPGTATDVTEPQFPVADVNNYFGSTFDYFNIHRLVVPVNSGNAFSVLGTNFPAYDQAVVLANSPYYGGSGGTLATTTLDASASEIAIHEIGHSFGFLADEYWAGDVYAAEKANMTQETNPSLVKWSDWMNINGIGIYQHCCGGISASWYRPHQSCKMRFLGVPFCSVCTEALIDRIYSLVTPIDSYLPTATDLNYEGTPINFSLTLILPNPNTLQVAWELNGSPFAQQVNAVNISGTDLQVGSNTLVARVIDQTPLSKSYLPAGGYEFTTTWTITKGDEGACTPGGMLQGSGPGQEVIPPGTYHYSGAVSLENFRVNAGANVILKAETSITLSPPFTVQSGAGFFAGIENCPAAREHTAPQTGILPLSPQETAPLPPVEAEITLHAYPNPARGEVILELRVPNTGETVDLSIFDLSGTRLQTVLDEVFLEKGMYQFPQHTGHLPPGVYLLRLSTRRQILTNRLIVRGR